MYVYAKKKMLQKQNLLGEKLTVRWFTNSFIMQIHDYATPDISRCGRSAGAAC